MDPNNFKPVYLAAPVAFIVGMGQVNPIPPYPYCLTMQSAVELASLLGGAVVQGPPEGDWLEGTQGVPDTPNAYVQVGKAPWIALPSGQKFNAGVLALFWHSVSTGAEGLANCKRFIEMSAAGEEQ